MLRILSDNLLAVKFLTLLGTGASPDAVQRRIRWSAKPKLHFARAFSVDNIGGEIMEQGKKKKRKKGARQSVKTGMSPGYMAFVGEQKVDRVRIDVIHYDENSCRELADVSSEQCHQAVAEPGVSWINVSGIHDTALIETLGKAFDFHSLTLADIVNTAQRLKVEEFKNYLFIVMKMLSCNDDSSELNIEHVSLILGQNYVISFQEAPGDVFDSLRDRIRSGKGRIRTMKADYLAYALMDAVVDNYFIAAERIGDRLEIIDDKILSDPRHEDMRAIHLLKLDILNMRKAAWPLREEISTLSKYEGQDIKTSETAVYWRDLYDHTIQIIDMVENFREILGGIHDTYLSSLSNRMNEIMKMLTVMATVFIPLTFIAGVYGMNFENMPELKWHYSYYVVLGGMFLITVGMLAYFRRKKWI